MLPDLPIFEGERPDLNKREGYKPEGGPCVTSTAAALWWLFTPHKNGKPASDFDLGAALNARPYWQSWEKPNPSLNIDEDIEDLILATSKKTDQSVKLKPKRGNPEKIPSTYNVRHIISNGELSCLSYMNGGFEKLDCPYVYVRKSLAYAVGYAYDDLEIENKRRNDIPNNLGNVSAWLEQAKERLEKSIEKIAAIKLGPTPRKYARYDEPDLYRKTMIATDTSISDLKSAILLVESVSTKVDDQIKIVAQDGRPEKVWWLSFVVNCGVIWTTLTGVVPDVGQPGFQKFLENATKSLGGTREQFRRQIETARERLQVMDPWNQMDAERKGVLPPGQHPTTVLGRGEYDQLFNRWNRNIYSLIEGIKNGSDEAYTSLSITYTLADDEGKSKIRDMLEAHGLQDVGQKAVRRSH
ncbi:hypothetical protein [Methylobacterium nodulans]|nr:hypothetical protein [Methylobacterium nodulans]